MTISFPGKYGNLYFSSVAANLASSAIGTHYTWPSPTIPKLQEPDSWLPVTNEQASWIVSLTPLGTALGPFLGGWLVNRVGRRWTIASSVILSVVAWVVLLSSFTVWQIYIGKFIAGMGGGIAFLTCPMYVAEISEPKVRGALGSLFAFFLVGGYLIEYLFGPYVSYSALVFINFTPSILFFVLFPIIPESPYYCLRKEDVSGALKSLTWLRSCRGPSEVQEELSRIQSGVRKSLAETTKFSDLWRTRGNRKGLIISCGVVAGQQFSGINVILFYAQTIFMMAGTSLSSSISAIVIGVILCVFRAFAVPLVRFFGMKNVMIISTIAVVIFQFALGMFFYLKQLGTDLSDFDWVPVTSLIAYMLLYTMGQGVVPWAVIAEVFPPNVKALASAISVSFCWFLAFLLTKFFHSISDALGTHFAFFFFAGCSVLTLLFTIFILPDTRGMTLQDILDLLSKGKSDKKPPKV